MKPQRKKSAYPYVSREKKEVEGIFPEPDDLLAAGALVVALIDSGRVTAKQVSRRNVAKHLRALITLDNYERQLVYDVIDYYKIHFFDQYAPVAYSGQRIRRQFKDLLAFFQRANPGYGVVITDKAKEYGERIWNFGWKFYELKEQIPILTQLSLDNILRFKAQLSARRLEEETKLFRASKGLLRSIPELLLDHLHDEYNEVCRHFFMVHKRVSDWAAWNGRLDNCVISLDNEEWMRTLSNLCGHYCGEEGISTFKQIVKECK